MRSHPYIKALKPLITAAVVLLFSVVKAQDVHFSQYDYSPLTVNPALTAVDKNLQVVLQHRDQWKALNGFSTSSLSFEMRFDPTSWIKIKNKTMNFKHKDSKGFAFGLNVITDKAGDGNMQKLYGNLSLAYHLMLDANNRISAGIQGGVVQSSLDPSGLRFNSQYGVTGVYDPTTQSGEIYQGNRFYYGDFAAGVCYSFGEEDRYMAANDNKYFKFGASFDHLSTPAQAFIIDQNSNLYYKFTIHGNTLLGIKNTPYSLGGSFITMIQGKQSEITFGVVAKYKIKDESKYTGIRKGMALLIGCYYRNQDAVIPYLSYELHRYAIGLSYDVNISKFTAATSAMGGLEVTLRFFNPVPFLYQKKEGASFN